MEILTITDTQKKTFYQFDREGKYIAEHVGISNTANTLNIALSSLNSCLRFKRKSAGGYLWSFDRIPLFDTRYGFITLSNINHQVIYKFDENWQYVTQYLNKVTAARDVQDIGLKDFDIELNTFFPNRLLDGHHFSYERYPHLCTEKQPVRQATQSRKVNQYTYYTDNRRSGILIASFDSIRQAGKTLNLNPSSIARVCKGTQMKCGGFLFSYDK